MRSDHGGEIVGWRDYSITAMTRDDGDSGRFLHVSASLWFEAWLHLFPTDKRKKSPLPAAFDTAP
jgi:hypothetical protein